MRNNNSLKVAVVLALMLSIFVTEVYGKEYCYVPYGEDVHPEFVVGVSLVTINWVEGERGMTAFASYMYDEETNTTICLITARTPDHVIGDPDMDALGHELLHCLTGDFHEGAD